MTIKETLNNLSSKINELALSKKDIVISAIQATHPAAFLGKQLVTHWLVILIASFAAYFYISNMLTNESLRSEQLKVELSRLNIDLEQMKKDREIFRARIKQLEKIKENNKQLNKEVKDSATKLSSEEKKKLLLQYRDRLINKRGTK